MIASKSVLFSCDYGDGSICSFSDNEILNRPKVRVMEKLSIFSNFRHCNANSLLGNSRETFMSRRVVAFGDAFFMLRTWTWNGPDCTTLNYLWVNTSHDWEFISGNVFPLSISQELSFFWPGPTKTGPTCF